MKNRDPWKLALAAVAGLIVLACGGGAVKEAVDPGPTVTAAPSAAATTAADAPATTAPAKTTTNAAMGDVQLTACQMSVSEVMGPEAALTVTNNSSKPSNYLIEVAFVSKDGKQQFDTGSASVSGLAPGQVSQQTASSLKSEVREQAAAGFSCKVLDVTRFAS